jgi:hypothetical protein
VEETIRFIRQSYQLEDIRLPSYQRPRNMAALVMVDIDGDRVVYVLDGRCGHLTPEVFLWNARSGAKIQLTKNDKHWGPDCKQLVPGFSVTAVDYPRVSGNTVVWESREYVNHVRRQLCMMWQGGKPQVFSFLDNPEAACVVPDVSADRVTWVEVTDWNGRRLFHDMTTGETKTVPTGDTEIRLGYLSGSNLVLARPVTLFASDDEDQDRDGILDKWEILGGVDWDDDGTIDLPLPGANPRHKNLYVEVDAMAGLAPSKEALDQVVRAFRRAPVSNPDGRKGIDLYIDVQNADTVVAAADWSIPAGGLKEAGEFRAVKRNYLGTHQERTQDVRRWNGDQACAALCLSLLYFCGPV